MAGLDPAIHCVGGDECKIVFTRSQALAGWMAASEGGHDNGIRR